MSYYIYYIWHGSMMTGVDSYIGQAVNVQQRFKEHLDVVKNGGKRYGFEKLIHQYGIGGCNYALFSEDDDDYGLGEDAFKDFVEAGWRYSEVSDSADDAANKKATLNSAQAKLDFAEIAHINFSRRRGGGAPGTNYGQNMLMGGTGQSFYINGLTADQYRHIIDYYNSHIDSSLNIEKNADGIKGQNRVQLKVWNYIKDDPDKLELLHPEKYVTYRLLARIVETIASRVLVADDTWKKAFAVKGNFTINLDKNRKVTNGKELVQYLREQIVETARKLLKENIKKAYKVFVEAVNNEKLPFTLKYSPGENGDFSLIENAYGQEAGTTISLQEFLGKNYVEEICSNISERIGYQIIRQVEKHNKLLTLAQIENAIRQNVTMKAVNSEKRIRSDFTSQRELGTLKNQIAVRKRIYSQFGHSGAYEKEPKWYNDVSTHLTGLTNIDAKSYFFPEWIKDELVEYSFNLFLEAYKETIPFGKNIIDELVKQGTSSLATVTTVQSRGKKNHQQNAINFVELTAKEGEENLNDASLYIRTRQTFSRKNWFSEKASCFRHWNYYYRTAMQYVSGRIYKYHFSPVTSMGIYLPQAKAQLLSKKYMNNNSKGESNIFIYSVNPTEYNWEVSTGNFSGVRFDNI